VSHLSENLITLDGELYFDEHFLSLEESSQLFGYFEQNLHWQEETIKIFGRICNVPRLVCWYGDADAYYRYSGTDHVPHPWDPALLQLKIRIENATAARFNSVLGNLYRDEKDSMGWHSDDEKELMPDAVIASLSLGETRRFSLRHKVNNTKLHLDLPSGSLVVMKGSLQANWKHSVRKETHPCKPRINLTFRQVKRCSKY